MGAPKKKDFKKISTNSLLREHALSSMDMLPLDEVMLYIKSNFPPQEHVRDVLEETFNPPSGTLDSDSALESLINSSLLKNQGETHEVTKLGEFASQINLDMLDCVLLYQCFFLVGLFDLGILLVSATNL